jgi:hypothetical protein
MAGSTLATADSPAGAFDLVVGQGVKLCLSNGTLALPPGCSLVVMPGGSLEMLSMEVRGKGVPDQGLATVRGAGAVATLKKCQIHQQSSTGSCCAAVLVSSGGKAGLIDCTFTAHGDGLLVKDTGSSATAADCIASGCSGNGYAVQLGGQLAVITCTATSNKGAGFLATGHGSHLTTGPSCKAMGNDLQGFNTEEGATMICGQGCMAIGNQTGSGFRAKGKGSLLEAGPHCRAAGSGDSGFEACEGARLATGEGCIAVGNDVGFHAQDSLSLLTIGHGCSSIGNNRQGFGVWDGAKLVAGDDCGAR